MMNQRFNLYKNQRSNCLSSLKIIASVVIIMPVSLIAQSVNANVPKPVLPDDWQLNHISNNEVTTQVLLPNSRFATTIYRRRAQQTGPKVLIIAGIQGDQPAGVLAARTILNWPITRGELIVIPQANMPANLAGTPLIPGNPATANDLTVAFPDGLHVNEARSAIGRALWQYIQELKPTLIIDLQTSNLNQDDHRFATRAKYTGKFAKKLAHSGRASVNDSDCLQRLDAILLDATIPGNSLVGAMHRQHKTHGLVFIAHQSRSGVTRSRSARQLRWAVYGVLEHLKMIHPPLHPDQLLSVRPDHDHIIRVGIYSGPGAASTSGHGPHWLIQSWAHLEDIEFTIIGAEEARSNAIRQFDVLYFGGGLSSRQGKTLGDVGLENVRRFIHDGGGFVGVCAGFFLLMPGSSNQLGIIQAQVAHPENKYFAKAKVDIELTIEGKKRLGQNPEGELFETRAKSTYSGGPVVKPSPGRGKVPYVPLAIYREEVVRTAAQTGKMIGSPAIVTAEYGKGTVIAISCHPERAPGPQRWFFESFRQAAAPWLRNRQIVTTR